MKSITPKAPRPKFIIPKIRPSSFSLNETDKNILLDKNEFESINNFEKINKMVHEEENEKDYLCNNPIFKTLILMKNRTISTSSFDTKESDYN